jgi:nitrate/TMAO reductase-like tetraheme cytochrome c subunit
MNILGKEIRLRKLVTVGMLVSGAFLCSLGVTLAQTNEIAALDQSGCLSCHRKLDLQKTNGNGRPVSLQIKAGDLDKSAHRYIDCVSCHPGDPHDTALKLTKLSSAKECGTCHQYEATQASASVHGQQLSQGNSDVATCVDCHSPTGDAHSVMRVLDYDASTHKKNIAETCGKCHNNVKLMGSYGVVEKVYETYMASFHGKAIQLSGHGTNQLDAATCTNCHGVHNIKAVNDPNSPVAGMENLSSTCEQCHPGSGPEFAKSFMGHKQASPSYIPAAHYVEASFGFLLYVVLGMGAIVVLAAIFSYTRNRWRSH